jgi:RHS repeat-associated protein
MLLACSDSSQVDDDGETTASLHQNLTKGTPGANPGDTDYCNDSGHLCGLGEGDCDSSAQCTPGLACVPGNLAKRGSLTGDACAPSYCGNGQKDGDETSIDCGGSCGSDCTVRCDSPNGTASHCSSDCPCSVGEGDCDTSSECQAGLACGIGNGPLFGLATGTDTCWAGPTCQNGSKDGTETAVDCGGSCAPCAPPTPGPVSLYSNGAALPIVVAPHTNTNLHNSIVAIANDLRDKLNAITGTTAFSVQTSATNTPSGISLGIDGDFPSAGWPYQGYFRPTDLYVGGMISPERLTLLEEYVVHSPAGSNRLVVAGATADGLRHAVWDLLAQLGYRHYFQTPTWEVIPQSSSISHTFAIREKPAFATREIAFDGGGWIDPGWVTNYNAQLEAWRKHNRLKGSALSPTTTYPSMMTYWDQQHPGQPIPPSLLTGPGAHTEHNLCLTGTALVNSQQTTALDIIKYWALAQTSSSILSVSPHGTTSWQSAANPNGTLVCNDINDPTFSNIANRIVALANAAAEAQPSKVIVVRVPAEIQTAPTIALRQNVFMVAVAPPIGGLRADDWFVVDGALSDWGAGDAKLGFLDSLGGNNGIPGATLTMPSIELFTGRINRLYASGVRHYSTTAWSAWGLSGPQVWSLAQSLWNADSNATAEQYRNDFLTNAFGPAAATMRPYFDALENRTLWSEHLVGQMYRALDAAFSTQFTPPLIPAQLDRLRDLAIYTRYLELYRKAFHRCSAPPGATEQAEFKQLLQFTFAARDLHLVNSRLAYVNVTDSGALICLTGTTCRADGTGCEDAAHHLTGQACVPPQWDPDCPTASPSAACATGSQINEVKLGASLPDLPQIPALVHAGAQNNNLFDTSLIRSFSHDLVPYPLPSGGLSDRLATVHTRGANTLFIQNQDGPLSVHVRKNTANETLSGQLSQLLNGAVVDTRVFGGTLDMETDWIFSGAGSGVYRLDLEDQWMRMYTTFPTGTRLAIPVGVDDQRLTLPIWWSAYFFVPAGTASVAGWTQADSTFTRYIKSGTQWVTQQVGHLADFAVGHTCTTSYFTGAGPDGLQDYFVIPISPPATTDEIWLFNDPSNPNGQTYGQRVLLSVPPYLYRSPGTILVPREVAPETTSPVICTSNANCPSDQYCTQSGTCQTDTGGCMTSSQCAPGNSCPHGTCTCSNLSACSDTCRCPPGGICDSDNNCLSGSRCENGTCQGPICNSDGDCATGSLCFNEHCTPNCTADPQLPGCAQALCTNGVKDVGETDVDCGGPCGDCNDGGGCRLDSDCADGSVCGIGQGPRHGLPRGTNVCLKASCLEDPYVLGCGTTGATCGKNCINAVACDPGMNDECDAGEVCTPGLPVTTSGLPGAVCAPAVCQTSASSQHCGTLDSECGECQCVPSCTNKGCGEDDGCGKPCSNACDNGEPCSANAECHSGSVCGFGIGEHFGLAPGSNACWPSDCAAGKSSSACPWVEEATCVGDFCEECPLGSFPSDAGCVSTAFSIQPDGSNFPFPLGPFPTNPVGATTASFEVSANGIALYTIPIEVPPGRLNLQPGITLSYSSTKVDGPLGIGWSLTGLSTISRCRSVVGREGAARAVRFDSEDRFCLDGQPLIQVPTTPPVPYGESGAEYRTEIDTATKIIATGGTAESGPTTFQAWTRDGRILTFGGPAAAWPERLTELNANVFVDTKATKVTRIWGLTRVEDRAGNVMKIKYRQHWSLGAGRYGWLRQDMVQDTGEILPELIAYGGKSIQNPGDLELPGRNATRFVRFFYEDRPDELHHYLAGALGYSKQRLTKVQTYVEGKVVRSYNLQYQQVDSGPSQLASIQECAPDTVAGELVCKGATRFDYFSKRDLDPVADFRETQVQSSGATEAIVIDTNGDGVDELLTSRGYGTIGNAYAYKWNLAQGSRQPDGEITFTNNQGDLPLPGPSGIENSNYYRSCIGQHSVADLNRDGRDELYYMCNDRRRSDYPNALIGYEWNGAAWVERSSGLFPHFDGSAEFADLNGDGLKDLVWCELRRGDDPEPRQIGFALGKLGEVGTYAGFEPAVLAGTIGDCRKLRVLDVDGDGADDLLRSDGTGVEKWTSIYSFENEDFVPFVFFDDEKQKPLDFNGDGLKDILLKKRNGENFLVAFNNGSGINNPNPNGGFEAESFTHPAIQAEINPNDVFVADVDGDGKEDIVTGPQWISYVGPGQIAVHDLFTAGTPGSQVPGTLGTSWDFKHGTLADLDGDGEPEYVFQQGKRFLNWTRPGRARLLSAATTGLGKRFEVQYDGWSTYADRDSPSAFARRTYTPPFGCQFETGTRFQCAKRVSGLVSATYETQLSTDSTPLPVPVRKAGPERHYSYRDLRIGLGGRGSFGVGGRTVSLGTLSKTLESYANKDFRTAGHIEQSSTTIGNQPEAGPFGGAVAQCAITQIQWEIREGSAPNTWFSFERTKSDFEGHPFQSICNWVSHRSITTDPADVDEFGNLLKQREEMQKRGPDGASTVTRTYTTPRINRSNWILGLVDWSTFEETRNNDQLVRVTNYEYDDNGLLILTEREPQNPHDLYQRVTIERNSFGVPERSCIQDSDLVETERCTSVLDFDEHWIFPKRVSNAAGLVTSLDFAARDGQLMVARDPNDLVSEFVYDAFGRPRGERTPTSRGEITYAETQMHESEFDGLDVWGALAVISDFDGKGTSRSVFDADGRVVQEMRSGFHGSEVRTERFYDQLGRLSLESLPHEADDASQGVTAYSYNGLGQLTSVIDPTGLATKYHQVDAVTVVGNAASWFAGTDGAFAIVEELPRGNIRVSVRDIFGEAARIIDAGNVNGDEEVVTSFERGAFGRLRSVATPGGAVHYDPDLYGRNLHIEDPSLGQRTYTYNGFGEVLSATDAQGVSVSFEYDTLGRQTDAFDTNGNSIASFRFDGDGPNELGRMVSTVRRATPGSELVNSTRLRYDNSRGLLSTVEHRVGATSSDPLATGTRYAVEYRHGTSQPNIPWALREIRYPEVDGQSFGIEFAYDSSGIIEAIHRPGARNDIYWELTAADQGFRVASERFGNGAVSTREYFALDAIPSQCDGATYSCSPGALRRVATTASDSTVQDLRYLYDRNGNLKAMNPNGSAPLTLTYEYDGLDRLKEERFSTATGSSVKEFHYNNAGDMAFQTGVGTYEYSNHRLDIGASRYLTDLNGNQYERSGPLVAGGLQRIDYDEFDSPWRVTTGTTATTTTTFEYEASGARVVKRETVPGGEKTTTSIDELYERTTAPGAPTVHRYRIHAGDRVVAEVTRAQGGSESVAYLHADRLGTPTVVTGPTGNVLESHTFTPFGSTSSSLTGAAKTGFTGHAHDDELGLINMRGRIYDPTLSRFLTADPYVTAPYSTQGWNRYAYVLNNPLRFTDPSGFQPYRGEANPYGGTPAPSGGYTGPYRVDAPPAVITPPATPSSGGASSAGATGGPPTSPLTSTPGTPNAGPSVGHGPAATSTYDGSGGVPSGPGASPTPLADYGSAFVVGVMQGFMPGGIELDQAYGVDHARGVEISQGIGQLVGSVIGIGVGVFGTVAGAGMTVAGAPTGIVSAAGVGVAAGSMVLGAAAARNFGGALGNIVKAVGNAEGGGGGKPTFKPNPAHTPGQPGFNPGKTIEPADAAQVFENAIQGKDGHWYGRGNGQIYRFFTDNTGGAHFSGMTGGPNGIPLDRIPIGVRREFGMVR